MHGKRAWSNCMTRAKSSPKIQKVYLNSCALERLHCSTLSSQSKMCESWPAAYCIKHYDTASMFNHDWTAKYNRDFTVLLPLHALLPTPAARCGHRLSGSACHHFTPALSQVSALFSGCEHTLKHLDVRCFALGTSDIHLHELLSHSRRNLPVLCQLQARRLSKGSKVLKFSHFFDSSI